MDGIIIAIRYNNVTLLIALACALVCLNAVIVMTAFGQLPSGYTCGSVLRKYAFKKVRPLDGILRVKKVRVLTRSIYFLNLTQPRLAPKLDGVMLVAWNNLRK